jgi:hypothetical protein
VVLRDVQHRGGVRRQAVVSSWKLDSSSTQASGTTCRSSTCINASSAAGEMLPPPPSQAAGAAQRADQRRRRGLAVGAGDGDHLRVAAQIEFAQRAGEQLDLADDRCRDASLPSPAVRCSDRPGDRASSCDAG